MLWLSIYLPHLALDLLMRGDAAGIGDTALAVYAGDGDRRRIHARNRAAVQLGIQPGMTLAAARALSASLQVHARDTDAECAALRNMAAWAQQFTPTLTLHPPDGLLLEVAGSLNLFAGIDALQARLIAGLRELGYHPRTAVAPTPQGAWLLVRHGFHPPVLERQELAPVIRKLPIDALQRPQHLLQTLRGMGLRSIGDCLRLPRAALARRLGPELVQYLDRVLGRQADPQPAFVPLSSFHSALALPAEVSDTTALLFAAQRLLLELEGFLRARAMGVQKIRFTLSHLHAPADDIHIGLLQANRNAAHLLDLLRERLDRYELRAPAIGLSLSAEHPTPLAEDNADLFERSQTAERDWPQLVEHLRARLGHQAVRGIQLTADHRPERAWRYCNPGETSINPGRPPRPLWLLPEPEALKECGGLPWLDGRLFLERGPERIENGWWDGHDIARDYFVARNEQQAHFWVFRQLRKPRQWFLHGVFG